MTTYKYYARTRQSEAREGFIDVPGEDELVNALQAQGLVLVDFQKTVKSSKAVVTAAKRAKMHIGVKLDDLITLAKQLQALLGSGITLLRSFEIISLQIQSMRLFDCVESVKKDISAGSSLKAALAKHPKVFSNLWVNIVETGEATGQLPFALEQLVTYLESSSSLQRRIKSALVYPMIVLCVAACAVIVFIVKIIPMFAGIYAGFGAQLPVFTQAVFDVCLSIKRYLVLFAAVIVFSIIGLRYYANTHEGRRRIDMMLLNIFLIGDIIKEIAAVRFASGLNMLIKSGTPILHALDITIETAGNVIIKEMLQVVKENVREGRSMAEPLIKCGIFPEMLAHMVAVGEESGELANMLDSAGRFYGERVDATVARFATMFEPILIVVIGAIVGTLVIAMFLPIFGISTAISG
ncbi:MAG: type II secretion system F family protein [Candidatus Omnitrophota bacterium]|jgi:type IV pilus assembly protein PilC